MRALILAVAAADARIGALEESLKWGQPAYLPKRARVGTTLRIDATGDDRYAIYFHCQSRLSEQYDALFGNQLVMDHRSIQISVDDPPAAETLKHVVQLALTYHLSKKSDRAS